MPVDLAGNTLGTARGLNITPTSQTFTDYVDSLDPNDYYSFTFSSSSSLNLALNGLSDDADVQLLNSAGQVLQSSTNSDANPESLNANLGAGTYYIRVLPYEGASTFYNLTVSTASTSNTLVPERDLGVLSGTTRLKDAVGSTDRSDTYRFNLAGTSNLNLTLGGLTTDADIQLIRDANNNGLADTGEILAISDLNGTAAESINLSSLTAGNYFVQVYQFSGNTNYTLRLSNTNPSNLLQSRVELGNLTTTPTTRTDAVGSIDTSDIYRFNLIGATNNVNLALRGLTADADVRLIRDANNNGLVDAGEAIASSTLKGTASDSINLRGLAAGSYFAQVYQYSGNTNYTLRLSTTNPSNLVTPETNLGAITATPITRTGAVGNTDTSDIYGFSLTGTTNDLNLALTGLTADADVRLIRDANNNGILDAGEVLASSTLKGTAPDSINLSGLAAGNYFAQVYQYSGNTNYTLRLSTTNPSNLIAPEVSLGTVNTTTPVVTYTGSLSRADKSDFYSFSLSETSNLNVSLGVLSSPSSPVELRLIRDVNGNGIVDAGEIVSSAAFNIFDTRAINLTGLAAGNYFIQAYQQFDSIVNSSYLLGLSTSRPSDLVSPEGSTYTPITATPTTITGFVGSTDNSDMYGIRLTEASNFLHVSLTGLSADADLRLIRDANNNGIIDTSDVIVASTFSGITADSIDYNGLAAGNYLAQVSQFAGDTSYTLRLSTSPTISNLIAPQENLGAIASTPTTRTGFVGNDDTSDIYGFSLAATSNLNVALTGLSANASVLIIQDANNNGIVDASDILAFSERAGAADDSLNITGLTAGNYFVQVYQFTGETNYTLRLSTNAPYYASNLIASEGSFGTLTSTPISTTGFIGNSDNSDIYNFSLASASSFSVYLTGLSADAGLVVGRDANDNGVFEPGEEVGFSGRTGTASEFINFSGLAAGNYYVQVYQFNGSTNYNLGFSGVAATPTVSSTSSRRLSRRSRTQKIA